MKIQICRLCRKRAELQESHVIPAFVFRWLKESSSTGYLRFGEEPNRRVQDGEKRFWLCRCCESRLNDWETQFANKVFRPKIKDGGQQIQYEDWMLRFCVSVSWRVLLMYTEDGQLDHFTEKQRTSAVLALDRWAAFMLGEEPHPGAYEQHFFPMDTVSSVSCKDMPTNINRYLLRAVDTDVVAADGVAIVYSKLTKFILIGFIDVRYPKRWVNTKVHVRGGRLGQGDYILPIDFRYYLFNKCGRYGVLKDGISENQQAKIAASMRKDMDRVIASESFKALDNDVKLFGDDAFGQDKSADDRH